MFDLYHRAGVFEFDEHSLYNTKHGGLIWGFTMWRWQTQLQLVSYCSITLSYFSFLWIWISIESSSLKSKQIRNIIFKPELDTEWWIISFTFWIDILVWIIWHCQFSFLTCLCISSWKKETRRWSATIWWC